MKDNSIVQIDLTETFDSKQREEHQNGTVHTYNIDYFMQNDNEALALALGNLLNTYGIDLVSKAVTKAKKSHKETVRKVA